MAIAAIPLTGLRVPANDPLTVEHRREITYARDRAKIISKTARVAAFNGWTTALIAGLSAICSLTSPVGLALSAGIGFVAYNEFRGRKRLNKFDPTGATLLGWNQVGFLAMIVVYCLWSMYAGLTESTAVPPELKGDLDAALGPGGLDGLYKQVVVYFYGGVIVLSALFQGGTALYYFSRRRHVEDFLVETPEWVRDVLHNSMQS